MNQNLLNDLDNKIKSNIDKLYYSKYIAKNDRGVKLNLAEHTLDVYNDLIYLYNRRKFVFDKYSSIMNIDISDILLDISYSILLHDWGKSNEVWQSKCKSNNLRSVGLRHEFIKLLDIIDVLSKLKKIDSDSYSDKLYKLQNIIIPILSHHVKLSYRHESRFLETEKFLKNNSNFKFLEDEFSKYGLGGIKKTFIKLIESLPLDNYLIDWYMNSMPRYFTQLSDKRASAKEANNYVTKYSDMFSYELDKSWSLRNLQKIAIDNSDDNLLLLRAPTGAGKTLASILWANKQISNNKSDRLIIVMPTKFTSNSLTKAVAGYGIEDVNTHHSGAKLDMYINYKEDCDNYNKLYRLSSDYKHIKNLESNVTVCTIDHILTSMTLTKEEHHHRLFNFTNSCLVIDESDFYGYFINSNIVELLKFTYRFKIPVMIMSATLPNSYIKYLTDNTPYENINIKDDESDLKRKRINIKNIIEYKSLESKLDYALKRDSVIIYANTIEGSKKIYKYIKENSNRKDIVLYHSRFKECDKSIKEKLILKMLGKESYERGESKGIVIMTQIGELSIDISTPYMISEICPIDRLIQRFGRSSRFDKSVAEIDLFRSEDTPFPYVIKKGKVYIPNKYYKRTNDILKEGEFGGYDYLDMINEVYDVFEVSKESVDNSKRLMKEFKENIYMNPEKFIDEDDVDSEIDWRCRDIISQLSIYIGCPKDNYINYQEMEMDININSVNIPMYKSDSIQNYIIEHIVNIDNNGDKVTIKSISDEFYNSETGFEFPTENKINNTDY